MIKKVKLFLSNHPRMRIVVILFGAIGIFSVAMNVMKYKEETVEPEAPASSIETQGVPLDNQLGKNISNSKKNSSSSFCCG